MNLHKFEVNMRKTPGHLLIRFIWLFLLLSSLSLLLLFQRRYSYGQISTRNNLRIIGDRTELIHFLPRDAEVLELGVRDAKHASEILYLSDALQKNLFYTGVDSWSIGKHTTDEYAKALKNLRGQRSKSTLIRASFKDIGNFFESEQFDFIYVDGFAGTGEEKGKTFWMSWPYLKGGGIFAGHDYASKKYPLVTKYLDEFKKSVAPNETLYVTEKGDDSGDNERSFYFRKP